MKWIVLVIVAYIAGYTFINFAYRKPAGSAHEPAVEARERKKRTVQTTMNGWTRLAADYVATSTNDLQARADIVRKPLPQPLDRALPPDLPPIVPGLPSLHPAPIKINAPAVVSATDSLRIRLEIPVDASVPAFGEALAYTKDNHLYVFIQDSKRLALDSQPTLASATLSIALPPAALHAGAWTCSAFTAASAFEWSFTVE